LRKDFPVPHVPAIKIGQTAKSEVRKLFGSPWLSGNQDGELAWTYGNYDYSVFGKRKAKDLVIQFDDNGVVTTYTFSTTEYKE
jgi:outer membrane protein assembly factor BamE (lipoprotein component of BamABCDE complex)